MPLQIKFKPLSKNNRFHVRNILKCEFIYSTFLSDTCCNIFESHAEYINTGPSTATRINGDKCHWTELFLKHKIIFCIVCERMNWFTMNSDSTAYCMHSCVTVKSVGMKNRLNEFQGKLETIIHKNITATEKLNHQPQNLHVKCAAK